MATKIKEKWEIKDRTYFLHRISPLTYKIKSRGIIWFDEDTGTNRELRYAVNQNSIFADEQDGLAQLGHVIFEDGMLFVPRTNPVLQMLLTKYHPEAGRTWYEHDEAAVAEDDIDTIEYELKALNLVSELDIDHLEAIMRTEIGSNVNNLSTKELKRDAYLFAKGNPKLFIELSEDEDLKLRNLANRAVEAGLLKLTDDGTTFKLSKTDKKVLTVPFDTNPYAALAQYFKTDEGVALMKSLIKKLG